jgi:hypothetical protein
MGMKSCISTSIGFSGKALLAGDKETGREVQQERPNLALVLPSLQIG